MNFLFRLLTRELLLTARRPWRVLGILSKQRVRAYVADIDRRRLILKYGESWMVHESDAAFLRRAYASYQDYIAHQRSKLAQVDLAWYDFEYRRVLRKRLGAVSGLREGMTVLCLAARLGTEVKAFLDRGCFAVGIDLNPGHYNRYVVHGDFHDIQFPPRSVDVIFSNSLDHAFDLDRLIGEIKRVLKPRGLLIVEVGVGSQAGPRPGFFESFWWSDTDALISSFARFRFELGGRSSFDYPWKGEQLWFEAQ